VCSSQLSFRYIIASDKSAKRKSVIYRAAKEIGIIASGYAVVEITEVPKDIVIPKEPEKQDLKSYLQTVIIDPNPDPIIINGK
jgi:hypothetical protein